MEALAVIAGTIVLGALGIALALLTLAGSITDFFDMVNLLIDIVRDVI
nr:MAG: hypothetical protein [Bacteriophage sp.]